jgi:hypothetical protein
VAWLVFGLLIVGSAWWNLHTTFVRHPNASLHGNRDFIVRLAADLDDVRSIATFTDPEDFTHQAYLALLPGVEGLNLAPSEDLFEDQFETVRSLGPGTLVIYPLGEETYYGLCDRLERTTGGVVLTRGGLAGFEWCYVE